MSISTTFAKRFLAHLSLGLGLCLSTVGYGATVVLLYEDTFDTNTSANYTQDGQAQLENNYYTHNTTGGTLDYSRTSVGWITSQYYLNESALSLSGFKHVTLETEITISSDANRQPGLAIADPGSSGFGLYLFNSSYWKFTEWDDINSDPLGNRPLIGDYDGAGTYAISLDLDWRTADVVVSAVIEGPSTTLTSSYTWTDGSVNMGSQVALWNRNGNGDGTTEYDYLRILNASPVPEPSSLSLLALAMGTFLLSKSLEYRARAHCILTP